MGQEKIDKHGEDEENETWKKCVWMSEMQFIEAYTFGTTDFFPQFIIITKPKGQKKCTSNTERF